MMCLQSVLKKITERLNEDNLLPNLVEEFSERKFWATANLKKVVLWKIGKSKEN